MVYCIILPAKKMNIRGVRWLLLLLAFLFLIKSVFGAASRWSIGGFLVCGLLWYWLTWKKTRELDSPRPR